MQYFRFLFLMMLFFVQDISSQEIPPREKILIYSERRLPHSGILKLGPTGLIYLDVSNDYINKLVKFIEADGFLDSTCLDGPSTIGAHISVISGKEAKSIKNVKELGNKFFFTIKDCIKVHPPQWKAVDELYILVVEAPGLDAVRKKYGLPKKQNEFHITFGLKPKVTFK
jgi:hypothetical protein